LVGKNKIPSSDAKQLGLFAHHFGPSLIPVHNNVGVKRWPTSTPGPQRDQLMTIIASTTNKVPPYLEGWDHLVIYVAIIDS
jgi:hypothetical protein